MKGRAGHWAARAVVRAALLLLTGSLLSLTAAGCSYEPRLDPCGVACQSSAICPAGWSCVGGSCQPRGQSRGACAASGVDAASSLDVAAPDVDGAVADTARADQVPRDRTPDVAASAPDTAPAPGSDAGADRAADLSRDTAAAPDAAIPGFVHTVAGCANAANDGAETQPFPRQTGRFTVTATLIPSIAPIRAAGLGLSRVAFGYWGSAAAVVLFHFDGVMKVRYNLDSNYDTYGAETQVPYKANTPYKIRMAVDVPVRQYSVWVTAPGATEVPLLRNATFSRGFETTTFLDHWAIHTETGSIRVCDLRIESP